MRTLTIADTRATKSINLTGITLPNRIAEMSESAVAWMCKPDGTPNLVPSLPNGHALVCQIDLPEGTQTWLCNNVNTMRVLYAQYVDGKATAIRWYTGYVYGLEVPEPA